MWGWLCVCMSIFAYVEIKNQPQVSVLIFHMAWERISLLHHGSWSMRVQELSCPATSLPERDWDCRLELTVTPSILRLHPEPPSPALQWGIFLFWLHVFESVIFLLSFFGPYPEKVVWAAFLPSVSTLAPAPVMCGPVSLHHHALPVSTITHAAVGLHPSPSLPFLLLIFFLKINNAFF